MVTVCVTFYHALKKLKVCVAVDFVQFTAEQF